jgi:hypothetical protein
MQPPINNNRPDGKIGAGVYVAYQRCGDKLIRMYIGTDTGGPILQYEFNGAGKWDGAKTLDYPTGAWTPLYSHGNFGRNCACGGTWSSHTLHVIGHAARPPVDCGDLLALGDNDMIALPRGIKGDVNVQSISCEGGWAIWFATASEALAARLTPPQVQSANLPNRAKELLKHENIKAVKEVLEAYKL